MNDYLKGPPGIDDMTVVAKCDSCGEFHECKRGNVEQSDGLFWNTCDACEQTDQIGISHNTRHIVHPEGGHTMKIPTYLFGCARKDHIQVYCHCKTLIVLPFDREMACYSCGRTYVANPDLSQWETCNVWEIKEEE